ncbi:hypothetical protein I314_03118, partial [Cryptococcus bacillisporus CA1873]
CMMHIGRASTVTANPSTRYVSIILCCCCSA